MAQGPDGGLAAARIEAVRDEAVRVAEDLRAELAAIGESTEARPDDEHDAEGSTVGYERARVAALLAVAETSLRQLDDALGRLREGDYGRCTRCGGEIAPERLRALPGAAYCAACARTPARPPWRRRR